MKKQKSSVEKPSLKFLISKMMAFCSRGEVCISEVRQKLLKSGADEADIETIVAKLCLDNYIDESRYAAAFVSDRSRLSKWGPLKIKEALKQKYIPDEIINKAMQDLDKISILNNLEVILSKKMKNIKDNSINEQAKLMRFGLSRGFDYESVKYLVDRLMKGL